MANELDLRKTMISTILEKDIVFKRFKDFVSNLGEDDFGDFWNGTLKEYANISKWEKKKFDLLVTKVGNFNCLLEEYSYNFEKDENIQNMFFRLWKIYPNFNYIHQQNNGAKDYRTALENVINKNDPAFLKDYKEQIDSIIDLTFNINEDEKTKYFASLRDAVTRFCDSNTEENDVTEKNMEKISNLKKIVGGTCVAINYIDTFWDLATLINLNKLPILGQIFDSITKIVKDRFFCEDPKLLKDRFHFNLGKNKNFEKSDKFLNVISIISSLSICVVRGWRLWDQRQNFNKNLKEYNDEFIKIQDKYKKFKLEEKPKLDSELEENLISKAKLLDEILTDIKNLRDRIKRHMEDLERQKREAKGNLFKDGIQFGVSLLRGYHDPSFFSIMETVGKGLTTTFSLAEIVQYSKFLNELKELDRKYEKFEKEIQSIYDRCKEEFDCVVSKH